MTQYGLISRERPSLLRALAFHHEGSVTGGSTVFQKGDYINNCRTTHSEKLIFTSNFYLKELLRNKRAEILVV